ncbi:MAG: SDR family NAD(P)-dependent oxidoreductase [Candidatus Woesearchaeota archaeon]
MRQVLVTGAAGFIGSHVCDALLEKGYKVIAVDVFDDTYYSEAMKRENISHLLGHDRFTFYEEDITDAESINRLVSEEDPDTVIHLAARAGVRPSIENPSGHIKANVDGTGVLLEQCARYGIRHFIFASSSSVYGNTKEIPFKEDADISRPISQYAATKVAGEALCYTYHHLYDMDISCLRFFTVYGPRGRPDMAIAKWTDKIYAEEPIELYGSGKLKRDFTHISDIVSGVISAMENVEGFRIYNLGNSEPVIISELVGIIEHNLGKKARIILKGKQPGDVDLTCADITRAGKELGYNPKMPIEKGVEDYVRWYLGKK